MTEMSYFDGLNFPYFGINRTSNIKTDAHPFFYGLQYIHSGSFYLSVNDGPVYELKSPAAFLTSPDSRFAYGSPGNTVREHYFVCFEGKRVDSFLQKGLFIPAKNQELPYIPITFPESFLADMLALILYLQNKKHYDFAVAKLESILLQLQNQTPPDTFCGFHQAHLKQLVQKIVLAPENEWNFTAEAEKMNISLKHFRRIFQHYSGMPPVHFVLRQRVLKASGMLVTGLEPVKQIAYTCGFKNEFYFSRVFKKYMNISPELYRNKHLCYQETFSTQAKTSNQQQEKI